MNMPVKALRAIREQIDQLLEGCEEELAIWADPIYVTFPKLAKGEKAVGVIISADGKRRYWLILLPGDAAPASWGDQTLWAKKQGGELPDRVEGALLFAVMKNEFKEERYWTRELRAADSDYAWYQRFSTGTQGYTSKSIKLRARAVRRMPIG